MLPAVLRHLTLALHRANASRPCQSSRAALTTAIHQPRADLRARRLLRRALLRPARRNAQALRHALRDHHPHPHDHGPDGLIFGVTMAERGVSQIVPVELAERRVRPRCALQPSGLGGQPRPAFHLIERPMEGTWFAGARPVAAMARIAPRSSRRAPGGSGVVRPSSRGSRYFSTLTSLRGFLEMPFDGNPIYHRRDGPPRDSRGRRRLARWRRGN